MQAQRERARAAARRGDRVDDERVARFARSAPPQRVRGLRRARRRDRGARRRARRRGPHARQARALAVLPRGRRPGLGRRRDLGARRARAGRVGRTASTATRRCSCASTASCAPGDTRARARRRGAPPRDDGEPHRHAPAAARAAQPARRARPPGGLGRAPRGPALRLHAPRAALAPRSCARSRTRSTASCSRITPLRHLRDLAGRGARSLGATMLFGEKYGDVVRVVDITGYSMELCGGTHVRSTAAVGPFTIVRESSVGQGVRRIEAITGPEALGALRRADRSVKEAAAALRTPPEQAARGRRRRSASACASSRRRRRPAAAAPTAAGPISPR